MLAVKEELAMQKDFHFYVTYALAVKAGIPEEDARLLACADQFTDRLTTADVYGIQTQCDMVDNWGDKQIQFTVLIPFHFLPGDDAEWAWKTTENSQRARKLVQAAVRSKDPVRLGIALHVLQDTFSHQGFSGWNEPGNSCYPWYYLKSSLPNVGHAEMMAIPDMVDRKWYDPRTNEEIKNWQRAGRAARATLLPLARFAEGTSGTTLWQQLRDQLRAVFRTPDYDERKQLLRVLAGNPTLRYSEIEESFKADHSTRFAQAANNHLADAVKLFEGLPRVAPKNN
jgi:hypothetical protein